MDWPPDRCRGIRALQSIVAPLLYIILDAFFIPPEIKTLGGIFNYTTQVSLGLRMDFGLTCDIGKW